MLGAYFLIPIKPSIFFTLTSSSGPGRKPEAASRIRIILCGTSLEVRGIVGG